MMWNSGKGGLQWKHIEMTPICILIYWHSNSIQTTVQLVYNALIFIIRPNKNIINNPEKHA